ncbi:hypothetical protein FIV42_00195 [Persicimonas caeni]|uniref:Uncharacterized protein n=1 Tax=Persicimonas caeni TaxID=2292766 RepID=A0A4Y6PLX0_PERCE|nr:hypothetical protein [Persicimonas caeni]QDG49213.1 hypothetical protein FIV42_00195 [Persicimonas caeni]QED30434.1 hypothetical protein FRD00_00190 [Persicimonas caeni]
MSNKIGKPIQNQLDTTREVVASIDTHIDLVTPKLDGWAGQNEGQWRAVMQGCRGELSGAADQLRDAATKLAEERSDDARHLEERDHLNGVLYDNTVNIKSAIDGSSRPQLLEETGLDGVTPRNAKNLLEYTGRAIRGLETVDARLESPLGFEFSTPEVAERLKPEHQALSDKLEVVAREYRELETALLRRDQAIERWTTTYQAVASILEQLYTIAGFEELAGRIRPTARRARGVDGPQDTDADDVVDTDVDVEPVEA